MKLIILFLFLIQQMALITVFAQDEDDIIEPIDIQKLMEDDPFHPLHDFKGVWPLFKEGKDQGKQIPFSRRFVKVVEENETHITLANFSHIGMDGIQRFYLAKIPKTALNQTVLMTEKFPAIIPASHAMIRFDFSEDIVLTPQLISEKAKLPKVKLRSIVMSAEGHRARAVTYNLLRGLKKQFILVFRFTSLEEKFRVTKYERQHKVKQRVITFDNAINEFAYFKALVQASEDAKYEKIYDTLLDNCSSEPCYILYKHFRRRFENPILAFIQWIRNIVAKILMSHPSFAQQSIRIFGRQGQKLLLLEDDLDALKMNNIATIESDCFILFRALF